MSAKPASVSSIIFQPKKAEKKSTITTERKFRHEMAATQKSKTVLLGN